MLQCCQKRNYYVNIYDIYVVYIKINTICFSSWNDIRLSDERADAWNNAIICYYIVIMLDNVEFHRVANRNSHGYYCLRFSRSISDFRFMALLSLHLSSSCGYPFSPCIPISISSGFYVFLSAMISKHVISLEKLEMDSFRTQTVWIECLVFLGVCLSV